MIRLRIAPFVSSIGLVAALGLGPGCGDDDTRPDGWLGYDLFPAMDYSSSSCTPGACGGCCQGSQCLPGTDNLACGYGGNPCQSCQVPNTTCKAGACQAPLCDPTSCADGCCEAGECVQGNSESACGTGGEACIACKSGEVCAGGQCGPAGAGLYKVTLVSATMDGTSWTACGLTELSQCDLYVVLTVGNATAQSTTKENENNPTWNEFMMAATSEGILTDFNVEVRDDEPIGSEQIAECVPAITETDLAAGTHSSDCGDVHQLTWQFDPI